ncbi:MAG: hypothetical protein ACLTBV_07230 [Enterocloster bolteae]
MDALAPYPTEPCTGLPRERDVKLRVLQVAHRECLNHEGIFRASGIRHGSSTVSPACYQLWMKSTVEDADRTSMESSVASTAGSGQMRINKINVTDIRLAVTRKKEFFAGNLEKRNSSLSASIL